MRFSSNQATGRMFAEEAPSRTGSGKSSSIKRAITQPAMGKVWSPGAVVVEGAAGHEGAVELRRRFLFPGELRENRPVRERKGLFAIGIDRHIVVQNGADTIDVAGFMGYRD